MRRRCPPTPPARQLPAQNSERNRFRGLRNLAQEPKCLAWCWERSQAIVTVALSRTPNVLGVKPGACVFTMKRYEAVVPWGSPNHRLLRLDFTSRLDLVDEAERGPTAEPRIAPAGGDGSTTTHSWPVTVIPFCVTRVKRATRRR